jgi:hypothetical protein
MNNVGRAKMSAAIKKIKEQAAINEFVEDYNNREPDYPDDFCPGSN